jgi:hypothetical protein
MSCPHQSCAGQCDPCTAVATVESEARIAETHDIGMQGAERLHAAALLIRRFLWGVICVVLATWAASCTKAPPKAADSDLVAAPGVSAPVIERTMKAVAIPLVAPTPGWVVASARAPRALAAVATAPFDCQAYAKSLIPWEGPSFTDPGFAAAGEATLPDLPEFAARRSAACVVLKARSGAM